MDALDDGVPTPRQGGSWRPALVALACVAVVAGSVGVTAVFAARDATPESRPLANSPAKFVARGPAAVASIPAVAHEPAGATGPPSLPGPEGGPAPEPDPTVLLARSFVRTVGDGTTVRVYRAAMKSATAPGAPWAPAPPQCSPSGIVQADFSNDAIAGATQAYVYASVPNGVGGNAAIVGLGEGHGEWIVIAQVPSNAVSAHAVFPSGASDSMAPVNGVAVLASAAGASDRFAGVRVDAVDASRNVVGSVTMNGTEVQPPYLDGVSLSDCLAPTQLPPPGARQPADPAGAKLAVTSMVASGWAPGATDAEKFSNFDDSHGFEETQRELRAGSDAAEANSAILATVDNLVFLSSTEAAFQFTFHIAGFGPFGGFFGAANLVDGTWKMTRSTYCDALVTTNARCPA